MPVRTFLLLLSDKDKTCFGLPETTMMVFWKVIGLVALLMSQTAVFAIDPVGNDDHNIPPQEMSALQDFYESTNGTYWHWQIIGTQWNFTGHHNPCVEQWQGVICYYRGGINNVYGISLPKYNMTGRIPESFGNLSYLENIAFNGNKLSGTIPTCVFSLQLLNYFEIEFNRISGTLPIQEMSTLPDLLFLSLTHNKFHGSISSSVGQFPKLQQLLLSYNNQLSGTLPPELGNVSTLQYLLLDHCNIVGTIPQELENLHNIIGIIFSNNNLTSTIPDIFSSFHSLNLIEMAQNQLVGTLPKSLFTCTSLELLILNNNMLSGSIPAAVSSLTLLTELYISDNRFNGTIPTSIGSLIHLADLSLAYNDLTGSIPEEIYTLKNLTNLSLDYNQLVGTISMNISNLIHAQLIFLGYNYLTGSVPESVNTMYNLKELYLQSGLLTGVIPILPNNNLTILSLLDCSDNLFSKSIPDDVYLLPQMRELYILNNMITGSISPLIGGMTRLLDFEVSYNQIINTLPEFVNDMETFRGLLIDNNAITGSIGESFLNTSHLSQFIVSVNFLTGTVPKLLTNCTLLNVLSLEYNLLSGSLPDDMLSPLVLVAYLALNNNNFEGHLPSVKHMPYLNIYFANNNQFSGSLDDVFNSNRTQQIVFSYADFGNNQLTGTLPSIIFEFTELTAFTAVSNCITGPIPLEICSLQWLTILDLDGLNTAPACQRRFLPDSSLSTYMLTGGVTGGIPSCLFNMTRLETLHVSGNAIEWHFPDDLVVSDVLLDLSLSHNALTGTIPHSIQNHFWKSLDLSYNRLGGVLYNELKADENTTLTLQVNRLSGDIPSSLQDSPHINILNGNVFACELSHDTLPEHDPNYENYQCGSNSFNQAIVTWGVLAVLGVCAIIIVAWSLYQLRKAHGERDITEWQAYIVRHYRKVELWINVLTVESTSNLTALCVMLDSLRTTTITVTMVVLCVFFPLYLGLSTDYSVLSYQYAWYVSAAYLKGKIPGVLLAVTCILFVVSLLYAQHLRRHSDTHRVVVVTSVKACGVTRNYTRIVCLSIILTVNCLTLIGLNSAYVYITLTYGTELIIFAQVCVALFKLFWNDVAVRFVILRARELYHTQGEKLQSQKDEEMPFLTFIILFNSILAPCLANMAVSPSCFKNVIVSVSKVTSTVSYNKCSSYELEQLSFQCLAHSATDVSTSYAPPFMYNYQCSSSFVTNYASVYVYMYLFVAFVKPVFIAMLAQTYNACSPTNKWFPMLDRTIYTLLRVGRVAIGHSLFVKEPFMLRVIGKLSIFLTFGVMFPPLAVVICVALVVDTYVIQLMIGHFLTSTVDEQLRHQYTLQLERDCQGVGEEQNYHSGLVILFAALFYAFFVFDIYGDAAGWKGALVVAVFVFAIPALWMLMTRFYEQCSDARREDTSKVDHQKTVNVTSNTLHKKTQSSGTSEVETLHEGIRMSNMSETF